MSPVAIHNYVHFNPGGGPPAGSPGAPTAVTSVTRDSGATVSFLAPAVTGGSGITSYTVTPYAGGVAQSPTVTAVTSLGSITGSDTSTYLQADVTGLANSTAYTFTVKATNTQGTGPESAASGANTPLPYLVFGDDFNGGAGGAIDPEWWVYTRCGYLAQSEIQYYLADHCTLDGAGNLALTAEHTSYTGPSYPTAGGGDVTQPWRSGACQSNVKTWAPAAGNTMTFETRTQICPGTGHGGSAGGLWPGLLWLQGQDYLDAWKTDPHQGAWDATGKAEIDVQEWNTASASVYLNNVRTTAGWDTYTVSPGIDFSQAMHTFSCRWKPGASIRWLRDGSETRPVVTTAVPASGCRFFLLLYLQILAGTATATQSCLIDYVRVYDQNLG